MSENDFEPVYQEGKSVDLYDEIDASGDGHPLGDEVMKFRASDIDGLIRKVADKLYKSWESFVREYLANAETACLRTENFVLNGDETVSVDSLYGVDGGYEPRIEVTWNRKENRLTIRDNGIGMSSIEVDKVFREITNSAVRDYGCYSGMFGMGVLSFPKFSGVYDSGLLMTHSRQSDENFSAYMSLGGVEPLMGKMPENEYGTKFQFNAKEDYDVRSAVEKYSKWMRVPVIYKEIDEEGTEVFNEDYGDKELESMYDSRDVTIVFDKYSEYFEAYCSDTAESRTLLLSMEIERNGAHESLAPFNYDIRFNDESGKIFKSSNGNEGCSPIADREYDRMLIEETEPYISESMIDDDAIVGEEIVSGEHEGKVLVNDSALNSGVPLLKNDYISTSDFDYNGDAGDKIVVGGDDSIRGRIVISEDEWEELSKGRAERYVPERDVESFDIESGEGDLRIPEPTSSRESLQSNDVFWKWLSLKFKEEFERMVFEVHEMISPTDTPAKDIQQLDDEKIVKARVSD